MHDSSLVLSASELALGYRRHLYSPVEVVRALSERIESLNPELNAFTTLALDAAASSAKACEQALMRGDERPLLGVPIAIKDMIDTAGLRTTYGSSMFANHIPSVDAVVVHNLKQAGAIILGKSATHEFAWGFTTDNPHFGPTRNPWNPERVAGGSSGGSAAAVAAGMVPIAIGTDTGGSIRVPSAFCGVAGLKPTYECVSRSGVFPLARTLDHVGPIARDPADLQLLLAAMLGSDGGHSGKGTSDSTTGSLSGVRVGIADCLHRPALNADIFSVWMAARESLRTAGATIVDLGDLHLPDLAAVFASIQLAEALHVHRSAGLFPTRSAEYGPDIRRRLELAEQVTLDAYLSAVVERLAAKQTLVSALQRVDVIMSPCASAGPIPIPSQHASASLGVPDLRQIVLGYTAPQNLAGLPACAVRAGFDAQGMPVGIQFTGREGADSQVLAVATAFHRATPEIQGKWPEFPSRRLPRDRAE